MEIINVFCWTTIVKTNNYLIKWNIRNIHGRNKNSWQKKRKTYMLGTQRRTVLSLEQEATRCPEGENWMEVTESSCPSKRYARLWGFIFQIITVQSAELVAGGWRSRAWMKLSKQLPENTSQIKTLIFKCIEQLPICFKLLLKSTLVTASLWPLKLRSRVGSGYMDRETQV